MHVADVDRANSIRRRAPGQWQALWFAVHRRPGLHAVLAACLALTVVGHGPASAQEAETCTPVLVTHTPQGSTGEERAVAITAQAVDLEEGTGWINVAWEVAAGVDLTAATVVGTDGNVRTLAEPGPSGTAVDVDALVFCGTVDPAVFPTPEEGEPTDPSEPESGEESGGDGSEPAPDDEELDAAPDPVDDSVPAADPAPDPAPTPPTTEPAPSTDAPAEVSVEDDSAATIAPDEQPDASVEDDPAEDPATEDAAAVDPAADEAPADEAASSSEPEASVDDEVEPAEDVEVLGVQLSREDEPSGPNWPILLLMLGLGILVVGVALSLWRTLPTR